MTGAVRAIAVRDDDRPFSETQIERYRLDLTQPLAPALLALQVQLDTLHGANRKLVARLREIETKTGHRNKGQSAGTMDFDRVVHRDLDDVAQSVSNIHYEAIFPEENVRGDEKHRPGDVGIFDGQASKMLAARALEDSSSMKTVAVITMVLLPAIFFAALFAMPLLQWDESPVLQDRFWVYLAFTLPSTWAVFSLWAVITKTDFLPRLSRTLLGTLRTKKQGSS
ncbi:hypothetical protein PG994_013634 [Apiospora phragmitis]|uniref:Uncharacterized protein n=1 Tax=Apiospora phragmitis TaxID=2905665 RepID=A0ABR1T980_9PEZI